MTKNAKKGNSYLVVKKCMNYEIWIWHFFLIMLLEFAIIQNMAKLRFKSIKRYYFSIGLSYDCIDRPHTGPIKYFKITTNLNIGHI